jgi:iron complex transport system substrate-binding protein
LTAHEPLYCVETDLITELRPDLVVAQVHCDVCAVTPEDVARAGCSVAAAHAVSLSAGSVAGIYADIRRVAEALGRSETGEALVADMRRRIDTVAAIVSDRPVPSVVVLEWTDPPFAAGNWTPELVEAAGGRLLIGDPGRHSTTTPWERILQTDPDYLVVAPCGFDLDRTVGEARVLERLPGWFDLRAVRTGQVAFADGNKYFNRSGMTIVETVEILAEILHGDRFARGWYGRTWRSYSPALP